MHIMVIPKTYSKATDKIERGFAGMLIMFDSQFHDLGYELYSLQYAAI